MADLNRTVGIIFQADDRISVTTGNVTRQFLALETQAEQSARQLREYDRAMLGVEKTTQAAAPTINRAADALKLLAASLVAKDFIAANVAQEQFIRTMTLVTGSVEGARREFEFINTTSNRLGIETRDAADAYAKFAAATKGSALEGAGARIVFEGFAGTLAQVGVSGAEISGAFVQLAQGISKGKFELEDLKSIAERFPAFFPKFAESLGITTEALFDLVSQGKITGAQILIFGQQLKDGLGGADFNGFNNNLARLNNAVNDAFLVIGDSGAFNLLKSGLQGGAIALVGVVSLFELLGTVAQGLYLKLAAGQNFDFGAYIERSFNKAADSSRKAIENFTGAEKSVAAVGDSGATAGGKVEGAFKQAALSGDGLKKAAAEIDKALKALGIDPRIFVKPVEEIGAAFSGLARNAAATGDQIIVGLVGALKSLPAGSSVSGVAAEIDKAFKEGRISAAEYAQAIAILKVRLDDSSPSFRNSTEKVKEQGKAVENTEEKTRKAEETLRAYSLEIQKLASNERIKNIEATVTLKVADLEANTKRVQAAFESITATVTDTGKSIGDLFGLFKDNSLSFSQLSLIRDQIDKENVRRDNALKLQGDLTRAQIDKMKAETDAISKGDALIKIDGANLQPHLEAFMWEILRTIQVRVNQDGLKLLLGS